MTDQTVGAEGAMQVDTDLVIQLGGSPVAVVIGSDQAVISDAVALHLQATVQRMCLYALEVADGTRPGPYCDEDAERHALAGLPA